MYSKVRGIIQFGSFWGEECWKKKEERKLERFILLTDEILLLFYFILFYSILLLFLILLLFSISLPFLDCITIVINITPNLPYQCYMEKKIKESRRKGRGREKGNNQQPRYFIHPCRLNLPTIFIKILSSIDWRNAQSSFWIKFRILKWKRVLFRLFTHF